MLFGPEQRERFRDPAPDGAEAVQTRVAGGADGNQPIGFIRCRLAMVNMEEAGMPAAAAAKTVSFQHGLAMAAEAIFRVPARPVAPQTEAGDRSRFPPAGAKRALLRQTGLRGEPAGRVRDGRRGLGCGAQKGDYTAKVAC